MPRARSSRPAKPRGSFRLHAEPAGDASPGRAPTGRGWRYAALAVALALGIALLAMALGPHTVGDYFTETDFYGGYAEGARALQHGHLDPARYGVVGPGYEVALALVGFAVRDLLLAAELLSVVSVVAGVLLWVLLIARRADPRLAFATSLFLATNATLFRYGYSATTDAFAWALQALALALLLTGVRARDAWLAGLVAALAFLTRYSAIYLLPAGLVALWFGGTRFPGRGGATWRFAVGFAAPVVPWVIFSLAHGGSLRLQLHHNIAYDVFARSRGIAWDDYQKLMQPEFHSLWDVIARDPAAVARRELFNVWDHLRLDATALIGTAVAVAALAGLVLAVRDGTARRLWPLWVAGVLAFLALVPVFYSERYSLPLLPIYATLAGAAFASPRFAFAIGRSGRLWLKPALALIPLVAALDASARAQARVIDQLPVEVLGAARVLRAEARPGDRVIARKPHIAFHGGVEAVPFPFTRTLADLAAYARHERAGWLYFSWPEAELRPDYYYLLDTSAAVPGLTARSVSPAHPAVLYRIGAEFGTNPNWSSNDTLRAWHIARARLMVNPRDQRSYYTLGLIDHARGEDDEAIRNLEMALRLKADDVPTLLALGDAYIGAGRAPAAVDAFGRALQIEPGSVPARVGLGWAALAARQPADAARLWRDVIDLTRDGATLRRMADVYHALGDRESEARARAALARLGATP
jgi:hypothetical protein